MHGFVRRRSLDSDGSMGVNRHDSDNDLESDGTHVPLRSFKRKRRKHKYVGTTADELMRGFRHRAGRLLSTCGSDSSTLSEASDTTHINEEIHVSKDLRHIVTVTSYNSPREGKYTNIKVKPLEAGAKIHQRKSRFLRDDASAHTYKPKRRKPKVSNHLSTSYIASLIFACAVEGTV